MKQIALFRFKERSSVASKDFISLPFERIRDEGFDFRDIPASTGIYGIHPYPAMFHFLVVRRLISEFSKENENILDPFMGSGVVAGECLVNGRNFVGYDINPLALLISKVRTTPISSGALLEALEYVSLDFKHRDPEDVDFPNIHYWFDSKIIEDLSRLRGAIFSIKEEEIRNFYKVVFLETVRRVSRTRYNEFKLLRKKDIVHSPQVLKTFREISLKNIGLLVDFYKKLPPTKATLVLEEREVIKGIPLKDNSIDLVVTSPPYGDSRTTVAYGQFSRLSLRWLGLEETVDRTSLGAKPKNVSNSLPSPLLYECIEKISEKDDKRGREVFSFYKDLYDSIRVIAKKVKPGGVVCFVVGNRRVKVLSCRRIKSRQIFLRRRVSYIKRLLLEQYRVKGCRLKMLPLISKERKTLLCDMSILWYSKRGVLKSALSPKISMKCF